MEKFFNKRKIFSEVKFFLHSNKRISYRYDEDEKSSIQAFDKKIWNQRGNPKQKKGDQISVVKKPLWGGKFGTKVWM